MQLAGERQGEAGDTPLPQRARERGRTRKLPPRTGLARRKGGDSKLRPARRVGRHGQRKVSRGVGGAVDGGLDARQAGSAAGRVARERAIGQHQPVGVEQHRAAAPIKRGVGDDHHEMAAAAPQGEGGAGAGTLPLAQRRVNEGGAERGQRRAGKARARLRHPPGDGARRAEAGGAGHALDAQGVGEA